MTRSDLLNRLTTIVESARQARSARQHRRVIEELESLMRDVMRETEG